MILRRPVPALSCTWLKDTVSRRVMDTTRPNLIYHQKNSSLMNFLMAKSTFLKKAQKALLKVLVLERNLLNQQPRLQVKAMIAITTDAEGLLHLLCHHRRNQLHLTTFIAVQLILILTVVVEVAVQVLLKHQASSLPPYRPSDRSWKKKSNFAGFLGTKSRKNRPILQDFARIFGANLAGKQSIKKQQILWLFSGQILLETDRFSTNQTSVFNVFLTEVIINFALSTTIRSRNEPMAKPLTSSLVLSFSQHNLRLLVSERCLHISVVKF